MDPKEEDPRSENSPPSQKVSRRPKRSSTQTVSYRDPTMADYYRRKNAMPLNQLQNSPPEGVNKSKRLCLASVKMEQQDGHQKKSTRANTAKRSAKVSSSSSEQSDQEDEDEQTMSTPKKPTAKKSANSAKSVSESISKTHMGDQRSPSKNTAKKTAAARKRNNDKESSSELSESENEMAPEEGNIKGTGSQEKRKVKGEPQVLGGGHKRPREEKWPSSHNFKQLMQEELPGVSRDEIENVRNYIMKKFGGINSAYQKQYVSKSGAEFRKALHNVHEKYQADEYVPIHLGEPMTFIIESSEKLPRAKQWIHVEKSCIAPDNHRLTHLPFMDGYAKTSEKEFTERAWVNFKEGIHGADNGCGEVISHYEVHQLFKGFERSTRFKRSSDPLIKEKLRFAFFTLFPNKFTYQELKDPNFLTLLEMRFNPDFKPPTPVFFDERNQLFSNLVCKDCTVIECNFHRRYPDAGTSDKSYGEPLSISFSDGPCFERYGRELDFGDPDVIKDVPKFDSSRLHDLFRVLVRVEPNIGKITFMTNVLCSAANHREFSCYEYTQLALIEKKIPFVPQPRLKREHYKTCRRHQLRLDITTTVLSPPCNHTGPCHLPESNCSCLAKKALCTDNCRCGIDCYLLFQGCNCTPGMCRTDSCPCYKGHWECSPITCSSCNCDIHAVDDPEKAMCSNIAIRYGFKKALGIGISTIPNAGYGLFLMQDVKKNELISDYVGELLTDDEAERRGIVYDEMLLSYHFKLPDDEQVVDSYKLGNLVRFANHKSEKDKPNCKPKFVRVNGLPHIGLYATHAIKKGEELFFDYRYDADHLKKFNRTSDDRVSKKTV